MSTAGRASVPLKPVAPIEGRVRGEVPGRPLGALGPDLGALGERARERRLRRVHVLFDVAEVADAHLAQTGAVAGHGGVGQQRVEAATDPDPEGTIVCPVVGYFASVATLVMGRTMRGNPYQGG